MENKSSNQGESSNEIKNVFPLAEMDPTTGVFGPDTTHPLPFIDWLTVTTYAVLPAIFLFSPILFNAIQPFNSSIGSYTEFSQKMNIDVVRSGELEWTDYSSSVYSFWLYEGHTNSPVSLREVSVQGYTGFEVRVHNEKIAFFGSRTAFNKENITFRNTQWLQ